MVRLFTSLGIPYHYLFFACTSYMILGCPQLLCFIVGWYYMHHFNRPINWLLGQCFAIFMEPLYWLQWFGSTILLLCFLPDHVPLALNVLFFPIYVTFIGPFQALHWWLFFLKRLYFPPQPRKVTSSSRSALISRKVRRQFLNKNKAILPCFAARLLILTAYRVQGCWAGMLGHKHLDSSDEDVAVLISRTTYDVQLTWSVPKLFALTRHKRPPDRGIITGLFIGIIIGCYYGAYLLSGYARLY
jgi:hypothetical protein